MCTVYLTFTKFLTPQLNDHALKYTNNIPLHDTSLYSSCYAIGTARQLISGTTKA